MSTRGVFGVRVDNVDKISYNHSDSYPSYLGLHLIEEFNTLNASKGIQWLKDKARNLRVVNEEYQSDALDWYSLQGELGKTLEAGVILDSRDFLLDSLFCEWGYVFNFDSNTFEVYKGFQRCSHDKGRYSSFFKNQVNSHAGPYYPCAFIAEFPLSQLPDRQKFLQTFDSEE